MSNKTFVCVILVMLCLFIRPQFANAQTKPQQVFLQNLANPDLYLVLPKSLQNERYTIVIYLDRECAPCQNTADQMQKSAKEIFKKDYRWLFLVNHKTWPLAVTELELKLKTREDLANFYHDPAKRFQNLQEATNGVTLFTFQREKMIAKDISSPKDFRDAFAKIRKTIDQLEKKK